MLFDTANVAAKVIVLVVQGSEYPHKRGGGKGGALLGPFDY